MILDDDFTIISQYQAIYRGTVNYYALAYNVSWFHKLRWVMQTSLLRTLASKHKSTLMAMYKKYKATTITPYGQMRCLEIKVAREGKKALVARFGGIPLRHKKKSILNDINPEHVFSGGNRSELIQRLLADKCELCEATEKVEVHHIRKLADLKKHGKDKPAWVERMASRRRKTLAVCTKCHDLIHAGKVNQPISK
jgi:hypothetical protein